MVMGIHQEHNEENHDLSKTYHGTGPIDVLGKDTGSGNGGSSVWDIPYQDDLVCAVFLSVPQCFSSLLTALLSSGVQWPHCDVWVCLCVFFFFFLLLQHEWA